METPMLQGRELKREDASDGYATRDKESNSDSCGHFDDDFPPR